MTPAFALSVDGLDKSSLFSPRLVRLTLTEKRGDEADQLDLVLSDFDGRLAVPRKGAGVTLSLGWKGQDLIDKGRFVVDEISHAGPPDLLTLRAKSADMTGPIRNRRERSWVDQTLGRILNDIAADTGLTVRVSPELADRPVPVLQQGRESDLQLLQRLGRLYDAVAAVKAGHLIFTARGSGKTAGGTALPSADFTRAAGDKHSWTAPDRDRYSGVSARWRSVQGAQERTVEVGADGNRQRLPRIYGSEASARQAAQAEWSRLQRGVAKLSWSPAIARPDLYPEQQLRLSGFKTEIDADTWLIDEVRHELGSNGLSTALNLETVGS